MMMAATDGGGLSGRTGPGRPRLGKELRECYGLRLEPSVAANLESTGRSLVEILEAVNEWLVASRQGAGRAAGDRLMARLLGRTVFDDDGKPIA